MNRDVVGKPFHGLNDPRRRVLRYVLKVGDLEEATHVFVDLLDMHVFHHFEYEEGSPDGGEVHYEGQWSRTLVGYGKTENEQLCLQLTLNHGVAKYTRGNHFHAIEIQLGKISQLEEAGLRKGFSRGKSVFFIDFDGYNVEVAKSDDGKNRISSIVLNCDEPISLSGPTVGFWTQCLGFEIVCWAADPKKDTAKLVEYTKERKYNLCCCFMTRTMKKKSVFKPLAEDELPYVELKYGCTTDFCLRLQSLPKGVPMDTGTGKERLILTCSKEHLDEVRDRIKILGKLHGGSETKKSFQLVPGGQIDLVGVVATDHSGLEVCFYDDDEIKLIHESQLDAEMFLRQSIGLYKRKSQEKTKRNSKTVRLKI